MSERVCESMSGYAVKMFDKVHFAKEFRKNVLFYVHCRLRPLRNVLRLWKRTLFCVHQERKSYSCGRELLGSPLLIRNICAWRLSPPHGSELYRNISISSFRHRTARGCKIEINRKVFSFLHQEPIDRVYNKQYWLKNSGEVIFTVNEGKNQKCKPAYLKSDAFVEIFFV